MTRARRFRTVVARSMILALAVSLGACTDDGDASTTDAPQTVTSTAPTSTIGAAATVTTGTTGTTGTTTVAGTGTSTTPADVPTTPAPMTTVPDSVVDVAVYFLRGERLVLSHRQVAGPGVLRGALDALFAGPDADESAAGMTSAVPADTVLRGVDLDAGAGDTAAGGVATVDVNTAFGGGGGSLSMFARVAQVVFTATQFPDVDRVVLLMDGAPIEALGGEGLILTEPQTRAMVDRGISGSVIIDTPRPGDTVTSPIRVIGEGDVFEAQFPIEIWRAGVMIGGLAPVTAGAMGTWARFDVEIPVTATPGPIELVAYDAGGCGTDPECPTPIRTVIELDFAG